MALQGDLHSFALPDVLRLLAGTGKTGRLGVTTDEHSGDVWLRDGAVVGGAVTSSRHAADPADVVFELLRFDGGSFRFEDGEEPDEAGEPSSVDDAIVRAEDLLREWTEVEAVVPSVYSWVTLAPELPGADATVSADQWRALAALGGGSTVRDLGDHFEHTDLVASRLVKDLVEAGLVQLGDAPEGAGRSSSRADASEARDDLAVLRADDGPVVLESRDDALLPEPLPSESTSFEGDLSEMASVDGRSFEDDESNEAQDSDEAYAAYEPPAYETPADEPPAYETPADEPPVYEPPVDEAEVAADTVDDADHDFTGGDEPIATAFGAEPESRAAAEFFLSPDADDASVVTEEVAADPLDSTLSTADGATAAASEGVDAEASDDSDRGALLNFLSTVKN